MNEGEVPRIPARTHTGCSIVQLKQLQLASREHGASHTLSQLARNIGLHRALYSCFKPWVDAFLDMIIGRVIYQGSKLSLSNRHADTCLVLYDITSSYVEGEYEDSEIVEQSQRDREIVENPRLRGGLVTLPARERKSGTT